MRQRVTVRGRVQGVWFRESCRRRAESEGVSGWVRNRRDGVVEAEFEGSPTGVQQLIDWCRIGPPRADVVGVDVENVPEKGVSGFEVR